MAFDLDSLTLGEVARVEEISHQAIGEIGSADTPKGRALAALAYVIKRRTEPTFSFDQAQELTLGEAQELIGIDDDEEIDASDPTVPAPIIEPLESSPESAPAS